MRKDVEVSKVLLYGGHMTFVPIQNFLMALTFTGNLSDCHVGVAFLSECRGHSMWKLRGKRIADLINELEAEGVSIDTEDEVMLGAYVRGDVCDTDLIAHVCQFQDLSAYQEWLHLSRVAGFRTGRSSASVEQVVREVADQLRRKYFVVESKSSPKSAPYVDARGVLEVFRLNANVEIDRTPAGLAAAL